MKVMLLLWSRIKKLYKKSEMKAKLGSW
jgi:hypothetical protein